MNTVRRQAIAHGVMPERRNRSAQRGHDGVGLRRQARHKLQFKPGSDVTLLNANLGQRFMPFAHVEAAANRLTNPALDPSGKTPEFK